MWLVAALAVIAVFGGCEDETKVKSVSLNPSEMEMSVGEARQIEMIVSPLSAAIHNPTAWKSSDPDVARVDERGNVTAVYAGECVITGMASHVEGVCSVRVTTPTYDLAMGRAAVYDEGVAGELDARHLVVRLYGDGMDMDSTGAVSGNGMFLNLSVYAPVSEEVIPAGGYVTDTRIGSKFSIAPGEIVSEGGTAFASGSFLGIYTDAGLSVVLVKSGRMEVENGGECRVLCVFDCERNEHIEAGYQGVPRYYNTSEEMGEVMRLFYTGVEAERVSVVDEDATGHIRLRFATGGDAAVELTARTPLSTKILPKGTYAMSRVCRAYTLTDAESAMPGVVVSGKDTAEVVSATLEVTNGNGEDTVFHATITTERNEQYILSPVGEQSQCNMRYIKRLSVGLKKYFMGEDNK